MPQTTIAYPNTAVTGGGPAGATAWTAPGNATRDDAADATVSLLGLGSSEILTASDFNVLAEDAGTLFGSGIKIPAGASIVGLRFYYEYSLSSGNSPTVTLAGLGHTAQGVSQAMATRSYGWGTLGAGSTVNAGSTWNSNDLTTEAGALAARADLADPGLILTVNGSNGTGLSSAAYAVDHVRIEVQWILKLDGAGTAGAFNFGSGVVKAQATASPGSGGGGTALFQGISSTTYASRTNTTITAAALGTITNGDLLLLLMVTGASPEAPDPTPPTGFSICPGTWPIEVADGSGFNVEYRAYYKLASDESGDYVVTHAACNSQGAILRFNGVKQTNPINPTPTLNSGTTEDSTALGLTTAVDGSAIVWCGFSWGDTTNDLTPPTGSTPTFTERLDTTLFYIATGVMTTAGATGDKTMANNSSFANSSPWGAALIAIEPAAAPAGGAPSAAPFGSGVITAQATLPAPPSSASAVGAGVAKPVMSMAGDTSTSAFASAAGSLIATRGGAATATAIASGVARAYSFAISGFAYDQASTALAGVRVDVYRSRDHFHMGRVTTGPTGYYSLAIPNQPEVFWCRFYLAGPPETFDTTGDNLALVESQVQGPP